MSRQQDEFLVEPGAPLAIHTHGGQMRVPYTSLASVVTFLGRSGYAVWAAEDGEMAVLRYWLLPIPVPRPWWKRLLRLA
jgi:hypothetical protein